MNPRTKTVVRSYPHHSPLILLQAMGVECMKQHQPPGDQEEMGQTIVKLEEVGVMYLHIALSNSLVWPCGSQMRYGK